MKFGFVWAASDATFRDAKVHSCPFAKFVEFIELCLKGLDFVGNDSELSAYAAEEMVTLEVPKV